ncbi:MAG: zf-TFIIB domain-containing protein [Desulfatibacillum sp.]|nr:zf-TFIIB domain-containing protein [Desulfatibacillum sp.]
MICPNCTRAMEEVTVNTVTVDVCNKGCGGLFFDYGELEKAGKARTGDSSVLRERNLLSVRYKNKLKCPKCGAGMRTRRISRDIDITMDICSHCAGLWLDHGEFDSICRAANEGVPFPSTWVHKMSGRHGFEKRLAGSDSLGVIAEFSVDNILDVLFDLFD